MTYALPRAWRERWPLRRYGFHGLSHAYVARRCGRARRTVAGGPAHRQLPPRRGRVAGRDPRRPFGRHDDGLHAARGPRHGDAVRRRRSRPRPLAPAARRASRWRRSLPGWSTMPDSRASPAPTTCVRSWPALRPATRPRGSPATSTCIACAPGSPRWRPRSAGWTCWCSPPGWGSTPRRSAAAAVEGLGFLGLTLDRSRNEHGIGDREIGAAGGPVRVLVITAREDLEMAANVRSALGRAGRLGAGQQPRDQQARTSTDPLSARWARAACAQRAPIRS